MGSLARAIDRWIPRMGSVPHPDPALGRSWQWAQAGAILLPFSISLGGLCWVVALGDVTAQRHRQLLSHPLNRAWMLLGLWLVITTLTALDPAQAALGLANFLPCFWFFAGCQELIQTGAQLRRLAWLLVMGAVPAVVLGLPSLWGWWGGPVDGGILVQWPLELGGTPPGRLAGVFAYANVLASYLVITFSLGLGLWCEALPPRRTPRAPWLQGVLTLALVVQGLGILLTQSRNAWGIGAIVALLYGVRQGWYWGVGTLVGAGAAVFWAAFGSWGREFFQRIVPAFLWARINDQMYGDRPTADLRITQWRFAWHLTQERPWTGWGLRNFTPLYEAATHHWLGHPHNFFLMLSAETGLGVTLGFMGVVGWILAQGVGYYQQLRRDNPGDGALVFAYLMAFVACVLFNLFDVTLFDYRVNLTNWLMLGAIAGVCQGRTSALRCLMDGRKN